MADNLCMTCRLRTCAFLFSLLVSCPAHAQFNAPAQIAPGEDYRVEVGAMFWSPTPELAINFNELREIGVEEEVDFVQEFGIEDKRFREFRVTLKPGRKHKIRFQYVPISYDPEIVTLQRTIEFGGRTFTVGLPADAEVEWTLWRLGYEWDFVSGTAGYVGLVTELKYNNVRAAIESAGIGVEIAEAKAPVPAVGVIARGYLTEYVSITGEFTGFKVPDALTEEFDAEFWDFDIYGTVSLGRNVGVQAGYRSLDVDFIADEDVGRLKLTGIYFGGLVRF
jgi:hypothetical protein